METFSATSEILATGIVERSPTWGAQLWFPDYSCLSLFLVTKWSPQSTELPFSLLLLGRLICNTLIDKHSCIQGHKLEKLKRCATREGFGSKKVWAQLTNLCDHLSHQIGFPCWYWWRYHCFLLSATVYFSFLFSMFSMKLWNLGEIVKLSSPPSSSSSTTVYEE